MASIRSRVHEAAIEGNVTTLLELLRQDPLLLDRDNNDHAETPLHVAALLGHVAFFGEILKRRPNLAGELDSRRSSPLHHAAAKGFVEIAKLLLRVDADLCFGCNEDGRNPVHLAAMRGRVEVLAVLVEARPAAAWNAVDGGTVLHLCVKYNQLEALEMLIETRGGDDSFVNRKDDYGFTVLHLAVSNKQFQTVQYLINNTIIEVNALNSNGLTALDILTQSHRDSKDMDIAGILIAAGASLTSKKTSPSIRRSDHQTPIANLLLRSYYNIKGNESWLSKKRDALMVVASLIATMAFQAGVSPPGGLWQDDGASGKPTQTAGTSIMAAKDPTNYDRYLSFNTTGFVASLSVILMLITGFPFRHLVFLWILIITMWIAVSSMALTYGISIRFIAPRDSQPVISEIAIYVSIAICSFMGLLLLGKIIHLLSRRLGMMFDKFLRGGRLQSQVVDI